MEEKQFACSQTAVADGDQQWENALDVKIDNFSISAAGKILFKDAALTIGHGRRCKYWQLWCNDDLVCVCVCVSVHTWLKSRRQRFLTRLSHFLALSP